MKKFQFQLEKLLTYKNQVLDSEMLALGELNAELTRAREELQNLETQMAESVARFEEESRVTVTPVAYQIHKAYVESMKDQTKLAEAVIFRIEEEIERQREIIAKAKMESRSLEILKEGKLEEYRKAGVKKEEQEIEEFVVTARILNQGI